MAESQNNLQYADVSWLPSGAPYSNQFDDIYFSRQGGIEESQQVFIEANDLLNRWQHTESDNYCFTVAELGFGTGLNFLLTWKLWHTSSPKQRKLYYLAFEKHPLHPDDLLKAHTLWPELQYLAKELHRSYSLLLPGLQRIFIGDNVILDLYLGEAVNGLLDRIVLANNRIDCWYLDGFSPRTNPAMWNPDLFRLMRQHSHSKTTLSTYSVAGEVRRNLQTCGFTVKKLPGPGIKREILTGIARSTSTNPKEQTQPPRKTNRWFNLRPAKPPAQHAIVIGAGLAGCSLAYSLSRRGWQVSLLEQSGEIASGGSGNQQAVLQLRLENPETVRGNFLAQAYLYSIRLVKQIQSAYDIDWQPCGVMRVFSEDSRIPAFLTKDGLGSPDSLVSAIATAHASEICGLEIAGNSFWMPSGGWLSPVKLCQAFINLCPESLLSLHTNRRVSKLERVEEFWQVSDEDGYFARAPVVVIANATAAAQFEQTEFLALQAINGQVSAIKSEPAESNLRCVVAGERFICPPKDQQLTIGASYRHLSSEMCTSETEDYENLAGVQQSFVTLLNAKLLTEASRVAYRCNAVDRFPVVGAVPDFTKFVHEHGVLRKNAKAKPLQIGSYLDGLFVNTAHGSYGLSTCPFSAEFLASLIQQNALPIGNNTIGELSPARFIIRGLKKQQIDQA